MPQADDVVQPGRRKKDRFRPPIPADKKKGVLLYPRSSAFICG
jgi:hypothetical protein